MLKGSMLLAACLGIALGFRFTPLQAQATAASTPPPTTQLTLEATPPTLETTSEATLQATPKPTLEVTATPVPVLHTVFLIVMENHDWRDIKGKRAAPYINDTLLPIAAHAEAYYNPPGLHPSEPNYLWLEAGTNFGILNDADPVSNHQPSTAHLTTLLDAAGIPWKSYQESIVGNVCPLGSYDHYAARHNPMVYFDDVTGGNDPHSANCIAHVRPYSELARDLTNGTLPRYVYITPNTCDDMHDVLGCPTLNSAKNGDTWLSQALPPIIDSAAYKAGGVIIITWDEGEGDDGPIGLIVLSPDAKPGYSNTIHYTHSSTLRTLEEIFGVRPFLGDAAHAPDLSDLFVKFP